MQTIDSFTGDYKWLSNFWLIPIEYQGILYPSTEHAYQASKTINQEDRIKISNMKTCREVQQYGQKVEVRLGWDKLKLKVMEDVLRIKFSWDNLRQKLINTGDAELIEGNHHKDSFWGVYKGEGENNLGKILMKIRGELR